MHIAAVSLVLMGSVSCLFAGSITVDTTASGTATYGSYNETAGPFPWSDLGFTAGASISSGGLLVSTGGSTSYTLPSGAVTGSETFIPGSTTLNLGYTPAWTGSYTSLPNANGNLNSNFVYNIGPISGSDNLFNVPLFAPPASGNLAPSLNAGVGVVPSLQSANGPGVGATFTLQAQAFCPFCVTVASASIGFNIGTRVDQAVTATPTVTYGDYVWYSKTQTYSPGGTFVAGSAGSVADTFVNPPGSLGLATGDTFYMNILPEIKLDMPVTSNSDVAVPASISASWDVFGAGGSDSWPLGDLFSLGTGNETFDFDPEFFGQFFYSIPLEVTDPCLPFAICQTYETPASGFDPIPVSDGIPSDVPPNIVITGGSTTPGGYGITNLGPLFPGDPSGSPICAPAGGAFAGDCITTVTVSPEPRAYILLGISLLLLAGGMTRRKSAE
jgi:hypothetical protein